MPFEDQSRYRHEAKIIGSCVVNERIRFHNRSPVEEILTEMSLHIYFVLYGKHINYYQECLLLSRMFKLFFSVDGEMELQDNSRSVRDPSPNSETSKLFRIFDKLRNNPKILLACLSLAGIIQGMIFTNVVISRLVCSFLLTWLSIFVHQ